MKLACSHEALPLLAGSPACMVATAALVSFLHCGGTHGSLLSTNVQSRTTPRRTSEGSGCARFGIGNLSFGIFAIAAN